MPGKTVLHVCMSQTVSPYISWPALQIVFRNVHAASECGLIGV